MVVTSLLSLLFEFTCLLLELVVLQDASKLVIKQTLVIKPDKAKFTFPQYRSPLHFISTSTNKGLTLFINIFYKTLDYNLWLFNN